MKFLMRLMATSVIAFALSKVLRGIHVDDFWTAIALAVVLAFLNAIVKPIIIILTLPATLLTFGLFLFAINAAMILLADYLLDGFRVDGFFWALLFSLLLSLVTSLLYREKQEKD